MLILQALDTISWNYSVLQLKTIGLFGHILTKVMGNTATIHNLFPSIVEISFSEESLGLSLLCSSLFQSFLKAPLKTGLEK